MPLTDSEAALVAAVPDLDAAAAFLKELVEVNSFTGNKLGVDQISDAVERRIEELGFRTAAMVDGVSGRHLVARRRDVAEGAPRLLLLGHVDTVHPQDGGFRGFAIDDDDADVARGPGVADMKGGLVVLLGALEALAARGALEGADVVVVAVGDEEIGSPTSGDLVRAEAEGAGLCLTFECGRPAPDGAATTFVTRRRGVGRLRLKATGAAGHSGAGEGASALLETAPKVATLHALSDAAAELAVSVGVLRGGTAANVTPATCELEVDYRFPDVESGRDLYDRIVDVVSENLLRGPSGRPLVRTTPVSHVTRPPLERTEAVATAAERVIRAGADLGLRLIEEARGGSSDAALAAEVGCPALCGLGVVGGDIHTDREWARLSSLRDRMRLAALVMHRFLRGAP